MCGRLRSSGSLRAARGSAGRERLEPGTPSVPLCRRSVPVCLCESGAGPGHIQHPLPRELLCLEGPSGGAKSPSSRTESPRETVPRAREAGREGRTKGAVPSLGRAAATSHGTGWWRAPVPEELGWTSRERVLEQLGGSRCGDRLHGQTDRPAWERGRREEQERWWRGWREKVQREGRRGNRLAPGVTQGEGRAPPNNTD